MKKIYSLLPIALLAFCFSATAQKTTAPAGISSSEWSKYENKTNILLESVDEASFINYIVVANHGDMNDMTWFKYYLKGKFKADRQELILKVGTGQINTVPETKAFFTQVQKKYMPLYKDYLIHKNEIVAASNAQKSMIGGGTTPTPFNCGSPCNNPGFESGSAFWDYWSGTACSTSPDPCSLVAGFSSSAHTLEAVGGFDPLVGPSLPLVAPGGGGSASLMIGDGTTTGAGASRASISFTVDASSTNFTYRYAVVLQDPVVGHTDPERPYFKVKLRDASGTILPCGDYEVIAKPPIVGFTLVTGTTDVYYRPWTTVFVPLAAYIGQCVTLEFTSSDCSQGGHFGYAYIDADCSSSGLITSSPAICGGSSITLSAPSGAATYDWVNTTAGGTTGIIGSSTNQTVSVNIGGTYEVTMTSVTGSTCSSTLTVSVPTSPNNPVSGFSTAPVCAGTPMSFTDMSTPTDSISGWNWDFNNDGIYDDTLQNPTYTFPAGGSYPVTLMIQWGPCNAYFTDTVLVDPTNVPVITPVSTLCSDASPFTISSTGTGGIWAGTGITNTATGAFNPATAATGPNVITYTTSGACSGADTITVNIVPASNSTWSTLTVCQSDPSFNLNTLLAGTATSGGTWSGSGVTGSTFNPSGLSGTISVTYTVGTTPCVSTTTQNITVTTPANATITAGAILCNDDPAVTLTAANPGGTWSGSGVNASTGVFNPNTVSPGEYVITYSIPGTCGDSDTVHVLVNAVGAPNWTLPANICAGAPPINLGSLVTGTSGGTFSGPGVTGNTFDPSGLSGNVTIIYTVGSGVCQTDSTLVINVDGINAAFTANPTTGLSPLTVDFTNLSSGASTYMWTFGNGTSSTALDPTTTFVGMNNYLVTLIATNANGCQDTASIIIHVEEISVLTVPNVFTPNGDGENETFHAVLAESLTDFKATIYDRWGLKMYEWTDANAGWNGTAKNGKPAPDGTYYYIINGRGIDSKDYMYTGWLQLLRDK
ncbi:MAG: gliding motility-associated C-terminal domain-containing protein [Bacteroidia bacterium]